MAGFKVWGLGVTDGGYRCCFHTHDRECNEAKRPSSSAFDPSDLAYAKPDSWKLFKHIVG